MGESSGRVMSGDYENLILTDDRLKSLGCNQPMRRHAFWKTSFDFHGNLGVVLTGCAQHLTRSTKGGDVIVESSPFMQWVSKLVKEQDRAPLQNRVERGQRKERR